MRVQRGITHIFVMRFANDADRQFYLNEDPAHLELAERLRSVVEVGQGC